MLLFGAGGVAGLAGLIFWGLNAANQQARRGALRARSQGWDDPGPP